MIKYDNKKNILVNTALTGDNIEKYLFPFERETDYDQRKLMSYYTNFMLPMLRSLVIPLFGQDITRTYNNIDYESFLLNVDGKDSSIEEFLIKVLINYKAQGAGYIIFEYPEYSNEPYLVYKNQTELFGYEIIDNQIEAIEFINGYTKDNKRIILGYTNYEVYEYVEGDEKNKRTLQQLDFMPIIFLNPDIAVSSPFYDIAKICINIYNLDSEQRDQERTSAFSILEIPNDNPDENVLMKKDSIIYIPTDASRGSAYISPDAAILKTLRESSESLIERLWKLASNNGVLVNKTSSNSGESYKMEFLGANVELTNLARFVEDIEKAIAEMYMLMKGISFTFDVQYTKTFAMPVSEVQNQIDMLKSAKELGISFTEEELIALKNNILRAL